MVKCANPAQMKAACCDMLHEQPSFNEDFLAVHHLLLLLLLAITCI